MINTLDTDKCRAKERPRWKGAVPAERASLCVSFRTMVPPPLCWEQPVFLSRKLFLQRKKRRRQSGELPPKHRNRSSSFSAIIKRSLLLYRVSYTNIIETLSTRKPPFEIQRKSIIQVIRIINHLKHPTAPNLFPFLSPLHPPLFSSNVRIVRKSALLISGARPRQSVPATNSR